MLLRVRAEDTIYPRIIEASLRNFWGGPGGEDTVVCPMMWRILVSLKGVQ